jgi:TetR/AcrR family transcriptional regulator, cholesterol catabolism regulator
MEEKFEMYVPVLAEHFMRFGIKSMTMDDIAKTLGISKKTIYTFVKDKNDLVLKTVCFFLNFEQEEIIRLIQNENNAIEQLITINKFVSNSLKAVHPSIIYDLQKYYPDAYKVLEKHKHEFIFNVIVKNLQKGIGEKLYRENINPEIIAKVYVIRIDSIFGEAIYDKDYNFNEVYSEISKYHLFGITSEKGRKYIDENFKNITI